MQHTKLFQPDYSGDFRCIGPACEDSCCEEWTVYVDQAAFEKYQALPAGPLRTIIDQNILRVDAATQSTGGPAEATFAKIQMNGPRKCPLLSADRLCTMQLEHGEEYLPGMCASYPRITHSIGGAKERALSLSCPEAARIVLLNPRLVTRSGRAADGQTSWDQSEGGRDPDNDPWLPYFWAIRDFAVALVQNRSYPLWQRLFLLDLFSRRFDAIAPEERAERVPKLLAGFEASAASGGLQNSMNGMPADQARQLDLVLRLAGMLLHESYVRPRFVECVQMFTKGIGNGPGATLQSLTAHYAAAHNRYYAPFFFEHPHILENYLINTVFRCQFPFGRDWARTGAMPSMTREVALLNAQFALMKGLLIGVSGFQRERLSAGHVVFTMQVASKHFEHHAEFLTRTHALLVESRMDGQLGSAIMLRNSELPTSQPSVPAEPRPTAIPGNRENSSAPPQRTGPQLARPD